MKFSQDMVQDLVVAAFQCGENSVHICIDEKDVTPLSKKVGYMGYKFSANAADGKAEVEIKW